MISHNQQSSTFDVQNKYFHSNFSIKSSLATLHDAELFVLSLSPRSSHFLLCTDYNIFNVQFKGRAITNLLINRSEKWNILFSSSSIVHFFTFPSYFAPFSPAIAIPSSNSWHSSNKSTFIDSHWIPSVMAWRALCQVDSILFCCCVTNLFELLNMCYLHTKNLFWLLFPFFTGFIRERNQNWKMDSIIFNSLFNIAQIIDTLR